MSTARQRPSQFLAPAGWALFALALTVVVGGVWSGLLLANLAASPSVPWSVAAMAVLLWALWEYLGGRWPPQRTSASRRVRRRARPVSPGSFAWAFGAGGLAIAALSGAWIVLVQVVGMPGNRLPDFSVVPLYTAVPVLAMASLVNSVAEEVAFRGYLQGELERRIGGAAAIAITALVMAPAHAATQGFVWPTFAFYLAVDAMLGASAYITDSILPGIATHAFGILVFFTLVWPHDAGRPAPAGDVWLWIHAAQTVAFGGLSLWAFARLAKRAQTVSR
ncbi:MAG: CPBP family intramembrane glutamic endopeptidase [Myxococcota bacterium]